MKVYIAAPWANRSDAVIAKEAFEAAGLTVTSQWIEYESKLTYDDMKPEKPEFNEVWTEHAIKDIEDIIQSDVFVILNLSLSEGKATEMGFAYGLGIPIVLVGERTRNIFYHLPGVFRAKTLEEAVEKIADINHLEFVGK